jgi:hypothetical protein
LQKKKKKCITQNENDKLKIITSGRIGYVLKCTRKKQGKGPSLFFSPRRRKQRENLQ